MAGLKAILQGDRASRRLEAEIKSHFNVRHCFLVSSGKAALTLILQALKTLNPHGDEVIIPAFNCFSVPSAIKHAGLRIRLCDLAPDSLDFDYAQLTKLANQPPDQPPTTSPMLCIIPTHLYGVPANIERLHKSFDSKPIIVEDAAQAMGGNWHGYKLGTQGDVGFFSLGRGKALSAVEGGIIITNRDDIGRTIHQLIRPLPAYGLTGTAKLILESLILMTFLHPALFWFPNLLPFVKLGETIYDPIFPVKRMSPFQAGLLKGWQHKIRCLRDGRREKAGHYFSAFPRGTFTGAGDDELPEMIRYPLLIENERNRAAILAEGFKKGLGIRASYPTPVSEIRELKEEFQGQKFPVAKKMSARLLTLPTHPYVMPQDINMITNLIKEQTARPA